jgi:hypothetical protein
MQYEITDDEMCCLMACMEVANRLNQYTDSPQLKKHFDSIYDRLRNHMRIVHPEASSYKEVSIIDEILADDRCLKTNLQEGLIDNAESALQIALLSINQNISALCSIIRDTLGGDVTAKRHAVTLLKIVEDRVQTSTDLSDTAKERIRGHVSQRNLS